MVQERLGHSSISITLDIHSAVLPKTGSETRSRARKPDEQLVKVDDPSHGLRLNHRGVGPFAFLSSSCTDIELDPLGRIAITIGRTVRRASNYGRGLDPLVGGFDNSHVPTRGWPTVTVISFPSFSWTIGVNFSAAASHAAAKVLPCFFRFVVNDARNKELRHGQEAKWQSSRTRSTSIGAT